MTDLFTPWRKAGFTDSLLPIRWGEKAPAIDQWTTHKTTEKDAREWGARGYNVGLRTRHFPTVDIDVDDKVLAQRIRKLAFRVLGETVSRTRPGTGKHALLYRLLSSDKPFTKRLLRMFKEDPFGHVDEIVVEILGDGQQIVLDGTHPSGDMFEWNEGRPANAAAVKEIWESKADGFLLILQEKLIKEGWTTSRSSAIGAATGTTSPHGTEPLNEDVLKDAIGYLPNNDEHYDTWIRVGMAIKAALGEEGYLYWEAWSRKSHKNELDKNNRETWDSFQPDGSLGAGAIIYDARQAGWKPPAGWQEKARPRTPASQDFEVYQPGVDELEQAANIAKEKSLPPTRLVPVSSYWPNLDTEYVPPQEWVLENWLPAGEVASLYGPGGAGKTLLAQQLAIHLTAGKEFLGVPVPKKHNVLCFFCEDDLLTIKRRMQPQLKEGFLKVHQLSGLYIHSNYGLDSVLMEFNSGDAGKGTLTKLHTWLKQAIVNNKIDVVIMDALADLFAGNENNRSQVRQFVQRALVALSRDYGVTVLMLAHPSKASMSDGTGYSGSTAWENSVRTRMEFDYEDTSSTPTLPGQPPLRVLTRAKSNYSIRGEKIVVEWKDWTFRKLYAVGDISKEQDMDKVFLDGLKLAEQSQIVLQKTSRGRGEYAPRWIKRHHPPADRYRIEDLEETLDRLLTKGVLEHTVMSHDANRNPIKGLRIKPGQDAAASQGNPFDPVNPVDMDQSQSSENTPGDAETDPFS